MHKGANGRSTSDVIKSSLPSMWSNVKIGELRGNLIDDRVPHDHAGALSVPAASNAEGQHRARSPKTSNSLGHVGERIARAPLGKLESEARDSDSGED